MHPVDMVLWLLAAYAGVGALFALAFVTVGVARVDPVAKGSRWGFRLLIFPGAAALWPVMLTKWARADRGESEEAHG